MIIGNGSFLLGDCLELMASIPDGSVDMVLCDLPYGTTACKWDQIIPFEPLWSHYWRVCKPNAAIVLTASQPFTSALVMSAIEHYAYNWVWDKVNKFTGYQLANKRPMLDYEDVCVFARKQPIYNKQMRDGSYTTRHVGNRNTSTLNNINNKPDQGRKVEGLNPKRIISFPSQTTKKLAHPTQKPVPLFEYLIKTYTNPGDLVLDNCAGSGTTAIAAQRSDRRWLCIERDPAYYYAAVGRVWRECNPL